MVRPNHRRRFDHGSNRRANEVPSQLARDSDCDHRRQPRNRTPRITDVVRRLRSPLPTRGIARPQTPIGLAPFQQHADLRRCVRTHDPHQHRHRSRTPPQHLESPTLAPHLPLVGRRERTEQRHRLPRTHGVVAVAVKFERREAPEGAVRAFHSPQLQRQPHLNKVGALIGIRFSSVAGGRPTSPL